MTYDSSASSILRLSPLPPGLCLLSRSSNPIGAGHPTRPRAAAEPPSELTPHRTVVLGVWVNPCHLSGGFLKLGVGDCASEPGPQKLFNHVGSLKIHSCTAECLFWDSGWQPTVRGLSWTKRPLLCPRQEGVAYIKAVMAEMGGKEHVWDSFLCRLNDRVDV